MSKTLELQDPDLDDQLGAFLDNLMRSLVHIQQQLEETETKDNWNIHLLIMIGPHDFISDTRSIYAQRHTLLLELRDRFNKMALLVTQYRHALINPSLGDRQNPLAIALHSNWKELVALQTQIAALPEA